MRWFKIFVYLNKNVMMENICKFIFSSHLFQTIFCISHQVSAQYIASTAHNMTVLDHNTITLKFFYFPVSQCMLIHPIEIQPPYSKNRQ